MNKSLAFFKQVSYSVIVNHLYMVKKDSKERPALVKEFNGLEKSK